MNNKAIVVDVKGNDVVVLPMVKDACSSCTSGCDKQGSSFIVSNPLKLPVSKGTVVILSLSKKTLAWQGLISLLFPFICSVAGYFIGNYVAIKHSITNIEGIKALFVLVFLLVSSLAVFLCTRHHPLTGKPEIIEIY